MRHSNAINETVVFRRRTQLSYMAYMIWYNLKDNSPYLYLGFLPIFIKFDCVGYFSVRIWLWDAVSWNV